MEYILVGLLYDEVKLNVLVYLPGNLSEEEGRMIEKEERNTGTVSRKVVCFFLQAMRYPQACLVVALTLMQHSLIVATDFWLSRWSEAGDGLELANATEVRS